MRFPKIFHADMVNIHRAAFWLAFFGVVADILGLVRDRMLAAHFGASRSLDIYYSAFRVPDFLYTVMLFFAASTAIIPIFLDEYANDKTRAERLFGSVLWFFLAAIAILASLSFFIMPWFSRYFLPGFSPAEQEQATLLGRILLFSPFLLGLSNIFSSVTQAFRRFFVYAISPVLYNIGIIVGIVFFLPKFGLAGLAWGVALGALLHMAIQIPSLVQIRIMPRVDRLWNNDIKKIFALSLPRTLGLATTQLTTIIFTGVASTLAAGSITIFNLATNLEYIPVTLIGLSYSVAAFPNLAEYVIRGATDEFRKHFSVAFRHIIFWSLPFAVLLLVLRAQIVRVILGSGKFSWTDTRLTAASLLLLSLAIVLQSLFMLLVRAFYAKNQTLRPLLINIVSAVLSVGAVFWFARALGVSGHTTELLQWLLRMNDIADIRALALPVGIFLGSLVNIIFLFIAFRVVFGYLPWSGSEWATMKILLASVCGGLGAYGALNVLSFVFDLRTFLGIFAQGFFAGVVGIFTVVAILWVLKSEELVEIYRGMKGMLWKDHVPAPEPEKLP